MNRGFQPTLVNVGMEGPNRCLYWMPWEPSLQPGGVGGSIRGVFKDKQEGKNDVCYPQS